MRRINYDSATVDISVFFFGTKTHFISEWYFFKNHEIGSLVVRKVKTSWDSRQNRELGPAWESKSWLMTFSSWLSPGRVKKLQKFINFCLKVGHSATLKRLKSTWRQSSCDSPAGWNVQQQPHRVTGSIYDSCRFDIGRFRAKPTDLRKVSTSEWHTQSHTPTMVQGGGGGLMDPLLPWVFDMLQYFEKILPSVESLWSSRQYEVYFMGGGAAGDLWHQQTWSPSWVLSRIRGLNS